MTKRIFPARREIRRECLRLKFSCDAETVHEADRIIARQRRRRENDFQFMKKLIQAAGTVEVFCVGMVVALKLDSDALNIPAMPVP